MRRPQTPGQTATLICLDCVLVLFWNNRLINYVPKWFHAWNYASKNWLIQSSPLSALPILFPTRILRKLTIIVASVVEFLKFINFEKATKIWKKSITLFWHYKVCNFFFKVGDFFQIFPNMYIWTLLAKEAKFIYIFMQESRSEFLQFKIEMHMYVLWSS